MQTDSWTIIIFFYWCQCLVTTTIALSSPVSLDQVLENHILTTDDDNANTTQFVHNVVVLPLAERLQQTGVLDQLDLVGSVCQGTKIARAGEVDVNVLFTSSVVLSSDCPKDGFCRISLNCTKLVQGSTVNCLRLCPSDEVSVYATLRPLLT